MTRLAAWTKTARTAAPHLRCILVVLLALILIYLLYAGIQTYRHVTALRAHGATLREQALASPTMVGDALRVVEGDVARLRRDLGPLLWGMRRLGWVPWVGPAVRAGPDLLEAGALYLQAGIAAWDAAGEPLAEGMAADRALPEVAPTVIRSVAARREELDAAIEQARRAADLITGIDAERLPSRVGAPLARIQGILPLITAGFEALPLLPAIAPAEGTRTYLLLAQNNDELRATGGFISSIGTLTFVDGVPTLGPMQDSYAVEDWTKAHPDPPEALREHMGIDLWTTRDANWSPDFPTAARDVAALYELNQDTEVHGVIAADMVAAARLLEVLTPLTLPNGTTVAPGEVMDTLHESWSLPEDALITSGEVVTATQDFAAIEVELVLDDRPGMAWFDSVRLEDLSGAGDNLVLNPSFEEVTSAGPRHWTATGVNAQDGITTQHAHSGSRSYAVRGVEGRGKSVSQRIARGGRAGDAFRVAAESRAEAVDLKGGDYCLRVTFLGADGTRESVSVHFPVLTHDWATAGTDALLWEWWRQRKSVVGDMIAVVQRQVTTAPQRIPWLQLLETLQDVLQARGIQMHAFDADLTAFLQGLGWNGAIVDAAQDYLNVIECNTGYNKVSTAIAREATYSVTLDDVAHPSASLLLRYKHTGEETTDACDKFRDSLASTYEGLREGCYWAYVRVYAPAGATLTACEGGDTSCSEFQELNRTTFATSIALRPGEEAMLRLEYQLPPSVVNAGKYSLYLQRQAGIPSTPVEIQFRGDVVPDAVTVTARGTDSDMPASTDALRLDLPVDQTVTAILTADR